MNDEPTGKRQPREQRAQHRDDERDTAPEPRGDRPERKPGNDKQGDWRGAGVCGDRHTD